MRAALSRKGTGPLICSEKVRLILMPSMTHKLENCDWLMKSGKSMDN